MSNFFLNIVQPTSEVSCQPPESSTIQMTIHHLSPLRLTRNSYHCHSFPITFVFSIYIFSCCTPYSLTTISYLSYLVFQYRNSHGSYNFILNYLFMSSCLHIIFLFRAHQVTFCIHNYSISMHKYS